jgi:succinate dehydrogenase/fumarate reductase cytochrome b subunit
MTLAGGDAPAFMSMVGESAIGPVAKIAAGFPLIYHYLGSVRHAVWDYMPDTVQNDAVEKSSYALLGVSGLASLGLVFI